MKLIEVQVRIMERSASTNGAFTHRKPVNPKIRKTRMQTNTRNDGVRFFDPHKCAVRKLVFLREVMLSFAATVLA